MNTDERIILHFKYCVLILVMIIIAVATDRWTAQKDFTVYLSNAATMTSLVLGLVAIFYSFISNDSLSKSLGSISTVSSEVKASREEISNFVMLTKQSTEAGVANASLLKSASEGVGASLSALEGTLHAISEQNQTLQALVCNLPARIDQLESKVVDVAKSLGEKPTPPQSAASSAEIPTRVVERFLGRPSLSYNLLTLALVLSAQTKKTVSIDAICKAISLDQPNTMNGFMMAMNAAQLLARTAVEGQLRTFRVTSIHPDLTSKTRQYIVDYVERAFAEKPMEKAVWLQKLANIEALFLEPPPIPPQ